jgi:glutathione S-transferase
MLVSVLRYGRGWIVAPVARAHPPRPEEPLELFDHESCPLCRKVREAMSELDLSYVERSCPRGDLTKRTLVRSKGQEMFPLLVDPNNGVEMYESEDIVTYLAETYGAGRPTLGKMLSPLNTLSSAIASAVRPFGSRVVAGCESRKQPPRLLELWNFEASPYCRKVRETLCALNLDYVVHNVAKRSQRRPELVALGGKMMVPYLVDPNTEVAMYESEDIIAYLRRTYGEPAR